MSSPHFGDLRSLLQRPPEAHTWEALTSCLERLAPSEQEAAIAYAREHLKRWPASLCQAPWHWIRQHIQGTPEPYHTLWRALSLEAHMVAPLVKAPQASPPAIETLLEASALTHAEHLHLPSIQSWSPQDLRDLELPPALHSLKTSWHRMTPQRLSKLAQAQWAPQLLSLDLSHTHLHRELKALQSATTLSGLEHLYLARCELIDDDLIDLAQSKPLAHLRTLDLSLNPILEARTIQALFHSPRTQSLRALGLAFCQLTDSTVAPIAHAPARPELEHLELSGNGLSPQQLRWLLERWSPRALRTLSLSSSRQLRQQGLDELLQTPTIQSLRQLDLSSCALGVEGLQQLGKAAHLEQLERLDLRDNNISAISPGGALPWNLGQLSSLDLGGLNRLGARGVSLILESSALRTLSLRHNQLGAAGALAIAQAPQAQRLLRLNLAGNALTDQGAIALARSPHFTQLQELNLAWEHTRNDIGDQGAIALAGSPITQQLRRLNLAGNLISTTGLKALLDAPGLERLSALDISYNPLGDEGLRILARSPKLSSLRHLFIDSCGITLSGLTALLTSPHVSQLRTLSVCENNLPLSTIQAICPMLMALPCFGALDLREQGDTYAFYSRELRHQAPILDTTALRRALWVGALPGAPSLSL